MHYSLLDGSVISVLYRNGDTAATNLPVIFTGLLDNTIVSFEALQPHQQQAWYSFLVQLAAMAVARENNGEIASTPDEWKELLLKLADGSEAAWHLVVDDVSKPAFMQPPVPEGSLEEAKYSSDIQTPDELDMLVTSKNHDLKGNRILHPESEHWFFALLTLQSMDGIMGRGNYGIIRMNSGYGNRPFLGVTPELSWSSRFKRDMRVLLDNRSDLLSMYKSNGYTLLWIPFWDGGKKSGIQLFECDPYFIEICRRIRFKKNDGEFLCFKTNTKASRLTAPDDLKGRTNDPWTPINKKEIKSLSVGENGFTYKLLQELLLGQEYAKPIAMELQSDEKNGGYLVAVALIRGMGKTNGLDKRVISIPSKVYRLFSNESDKELFAERARDRVTLASEVQKNILYPSISSLLSSGTGERIDFEKVAQWINRFDQEIDRRFFESLWASVEMEQEEATRQWEKILLEEAEKIFKEAERSTPIAQIRRLRAVSKARSMFYGQARKVFEYAGKQETLTQNIEE